MKTIIFTFFISLSLIPLSSFGQIRFELAYGGVGNEFGYSVKQTSDNGYILFGSTESFGAGSRDLFLIKTNKHGDTLWTQTYGGMDFDYASELHQTFDGGYILCGNKNLQLFVVKTNEIGDTLWTKRFENDGIGYSVQQTQDGGFILGGSIWLGNANYDMLLIKLNEDGETIWIKTYGVSSYDYCRSVIETDDDGFLSVGSGKKDETSAPDMYLVKTDLEGDLLWEKYIGGPLDETAISVKQTSDGGYIILGESNSFGSESFYVVKTDNEGDTLWTKTYFKGNMNDEGYEIMETPDGGYAFVGEINQSDTSGRKVYLIRTDAVGDSLWARTYKQGSGNGIDLTSDGGFVLIGFTIAFGNGLNDIYLIKTDSEGFSSRTKTSISNSELNTYNISAFPNPFYDFTTIKIEHSNINNHNLTLFDEQGQIVRTIPQINKDTIVIEKKNLPSGLYFFQITNEEKIVGSGKLILE